MRGTRHHQPTTKGTTDMSIQNEIYLVARQVERLASGIAADPGMRPKALAGTAQDLAKWARVLDNMCTRVAQLDRAARDAQASGATA